MFYLFFCIFLFCLLFDCLLLVFTWAPFNFAPVQTWYFCYEDGCLTGGWPKVASVDFGNVDFLLWFSYSCSFFLYAANCNLCFVSDKYNRFFKFLRWLLARILFFRVNAIFLLFSYWTPVCNNCFFIINLLLNIDYIFDNC